MFVLYFNDGNYDPTKNSLDEYYMPLVEIKHFNALIDNKPSVKNKQEANERLIKMSKNNYYKTGKLLDYLHHQKHYKLISINLSRQTNASIFWQINFKGKLEEDDCNCLDSKEVQYQETDKLNQFKRSRAIFAFEMIQSLKYFQKVL